MEGAIGEKSLDIWTSYKQLLLSIESFLILKKTDVYKESEENEIPSEFQQTLRRHKQNFINILKNPPKNSRNREEIRKGAVSGISLPGVGHQVLSRDLVDEAIILSDMFDLDELLSLELLCTAQAQMSYHPGLPRGLVAVLLYYDGRKSLILALKALILSRAGVSITAELPEAMTSFITDYTAELQQAGLLNRLLDVIPQLDLSRELELLQQNRALGGPKHQKQVVELFESVRVNLANCIFWWSAQTGLPQDVTQKLCQQLKRSAITPDSAGAIDDVTLALLMSLLYAIDVSIIQRVEEGHPLLSILPALTNNSFLSGFNQEFSNPQKWATPGLGGVASLAYALSVAALQQSLNPQWQQLIPTDLATDAVVDASLQCSVFDFMHRTMLASNVVHQQEFFLRRCHSLFVDYVVLLPRKVREMRAKGEEASRLTSMYMQQGLEPPATVSRDFEQFLNALGRLYEVDPLHLELSLDWWCLPGDPPRHAALLKFVKLAGDMIPHLHFTPYLKFLRSLSGTPRGAHCIFSMLKQDLSGGPISWDHFFSSLHRYYANLRQDVIHAHHPLDYPIYSAGGSAGAAGVKATAPGGGARGITPGELMALHAVLGLIQSVALNDPAARAALLEHPEWAPQTVLLGLVQCSVPIQFKAELILTLAALSRSANVVASTWHGLDAAQLLATCPTTSSYRPRGLRTELDEVESRNEEYPLTRAFLRLLNDLTNYPLPSGSINLDPYLQYVVGAVLLRFRQRGYRHPEEKWQVASSCITLLYKWLKQCDAVGWESQQATQMPGYTVAQALHTKSELLRLLLQILEEGIQLLDTYTPFPGKTHLETATLDTLQLLSHAVQTGHSFQPGLGRLLLSLNARTARPDHVVHVTRFIRHWSVLPQHALHAAILLAAAAKTPEAQPLLIGQFTASGQLAAELRHGVVECLEAELEPDEDEMEGVRGKTKLTLLGLVERCLGLAAPNLGLWLVGFDRAKDLDRTLIQHPGTNNQPRTVLHALLTLINQHSPPVSSRANSGHLLEAAWRVLYRLCSGARTASVVLRLLRANAGPKSFLPRQLVAVANIGGRRFRNSEAVCHWVAWVMKVAAVEIRVCEASRRTTQLDAVINALVAEATDDPIDADPEPEGNGGELRRADQRLLRLLGQIPLCGEETMAATRPQCELIDPNAIEAFFSRCQVNDTERPGLILIQISKLNRLLMEEIGLIANRGSAVAATQRRQFNQAVETVSQYATMRNKLKRLEYAQKHLLAAWRRLAETLFALGSSAVLSNDFRQELLIDTLHTLVHKVAHAGTISSDVAQLSAEAVVMFLGYFRKCQIVEASSEPQTEVEEVSLVSSTTTTLANAGDGQELTILLPTLQANIAALKQILCGLLDWLVNSSASSQKVRADLYGAVLHFVQMTCLRDGVDGKAKIAGEEVREVRRVLADYASGLSAALSHDATAGHYVTRMIALSLQTALLRIDGSGFEISWLQCLAARGHLRLIIDAVLASDDALVALCTAPRTTSLRLLYLHEARLALLQQVATSNSGALLLLELRTVAVLASMKVFDLPPSLIAESGDEFMPSVGDKFQQVLLPVLDLLDGLLTSLTPENRSCCEAVVHFLLSHGDMVAATIRGGTATSTASNPSLETLTARLTRLIARTAATTTSAPQIAELPVVVGGRGAGFLKGLMMGVVMAVNGLNRDSLRATELDLAANVLAYIRGVSCGDRDRLDWRGGAEPVLWPGLTEGQGGDRTTGGAPLLGNVVQLLSDAAEAEKKRTHAEYAETLGFIVENALYTIWTHLDIFLLRTAHLKHDPKGMLAATTQDLNLLKAGLVSVFTDSFCKSVAEFGDREFRGGLFRRIRRLLQFVLVK